MSLKQITTIGILTFFLYKIYIFLTKISCPNFHLQRMFKNLYMSEHSVGMMTNTRITLVGKPQMKRPLERSRCRWNDNIKMALNNRGWGCVLNSPDTSRVQDGLVWTQQWPTMRLSASQEGLFSIEFVSYVSPSLCWLNRKAIENGECGKRR
jgi:hypothetical protein